MIVTLLSAAAVTAFLLVGWVFVQRAWQRTFPEANDGRDGDRDWDALACRGGGCGSCAGNCRKTEFKRDSKRGAER